MDTSRTIAYGTTVFLVSLLFGFYTSLFIFSLRVLHRRKPKYKVHLVTTIALYITSSISAVIEVVVAVHALTYGETQPTAIVAAESLTYLLFTITNTVADLLLLFRCYIIWSPRKLVILVPTVVCFLSNALHFIWDGLCFYWYISVAEHDEGNPKTEQVSDVLWMVAFGMTLASTVLLTAMIAGRIWWICHQAAIVGPEASHSLQDRYNTVLAILIESGLMYLVCLVLFYAYSITPKLSGVWISSYAIPTQVAGIAPTFIIVRVGSGISIDNVEQISERMRHDHPVNLNVLQAAAPMHNHGENLHNSSVIDIRHQ